MREMTRHNPDPAVPRGHECRYLGRACPQLLAPDEIAPGVTVRRGGPWPRHQVARHPHIDGPEDQDGQDVVDGIPVIAYRSARRGRPEAHRRPWRPWKKQRIEPGMQDLTVELGQDGIIGVSRSPSARAKSLSTQDWQTSNIGTGSAAPEPPG